MIADILFGWALELRRRRVREAYQRAHAAHWKAVERGDTRSIHDTRPALLAAQTERLRIGA